MFCEVYFVPSDWHNLRFYQGFNFGWSYGTPEELSAYMYSCGKVCLVNILSVFILNDYVRGNLRNYLLFAKLFTPRYTIYYFSPGK